MYTMWLPIIYLFVNVGNIASLQALEKDLTELANLFIENLKADPFLIADHAVSKKSEGFITEKIDKFIDLLANSWKDEESRKKRSLGDKSTSKHSISILPGNIVPAQHARDIRLFRRWNQWFAASLEDNNTLAVYEYSNGSFHKILHENMRYKTNVGVASIDAGSLIVVGEIGRIKVFEFIAKRTEMAVVQTINIENPKHIVLWEQGPTSYLSVTEKSNIKIYQWLGKHFDHIQDIQELFNIKKTVPFNIHGSYFLAAVKYGKREDELKSYSTILKFNVHTMKFELFQRLLTDECTDIKYFNSELHGEKNHFLVIVHSVNDGSSEGNNSLSVIYKYEDQYFIPFQSIKTNAIEWQPIQDLKGNAALISVTREGLKSFQYNGWYFFESYFETDGARFGNFNAIHAYDDFIGEQILVFACDHCNNSMNLYTINFTRFDDVKDLHSQVLSWCSDSLKELKLSDDFELVAESLRGDLGEEISGEEKETLQIAAALSKSGETLRRIEETVLSSKVQIFENDFESEKIIFNNSTAVKALRTPLINGVNVSTLLDNVLDIKQGFSVNDVMEFNVIFAEKQLTSRKLNGIALERYITVDKDLTLNKLTVQGFVTFEKGLNVKNPIGNVSISAEKLLLKDGDQTFVGNLTADALDVVNLTTNSFKGLYKISNASQEVSHIKDLKVKHLIIGGLLNRVSVPVLAQRALKKVGNQNLEEFFSCDFLDVTSFNAEENCSGIMLPDDFALINSGEFIVHQDVEFLSGVKINRLEVLHSLNNVSVKNDGCLDILLTDTDHIQYIPAKKTFNNLVITDPIKIRNKITNSQFERMNPVLIDITSHELKGDVTVSGRADVKRWLKAEDLKPRDGNRGLITVLSNGVNLADSEIQIDHLTFTQPLDVEDVIARRVNDLDPHEWLLNISNSTQTIKGRKTLTGDLVLKGHVDAFKINGVNIDQLGKDVLRFEGDQIVEGVFQVDSVIAENRILSNNTYFKHSSNLSDIHIIKGNLKLDYLNATNVQVQGLINSQNISQLLRNIVRKDTKFKVFGEKSMKELHVGDLIVEDARSEFVQLLNDVVNDKITLNESLDLFNAIHVNNLKFSQNLNNVPKKSFDGMMNVTLDPDVPIVIPSTMQYDEIVVLGEVFIEDGSINGKNLTSIEIDTVKSDEDHQFGSVTFGETVSVGKRLELEGNIENLDLSTIVEQSPKEVIHIEDKTFMGQFLIVGGTLYINNTVNGINLGKFCDFSRPDEKLKTLKIDGDVMFARGPKILNINSVSLKGLKETLWFRDRAANLSGTVYLQNTTFNSSLQVTGYVDSQDLRLLSKNYLSKSKHQTITASLAFDNVTFSNISTPQLSIKGSVNGIFLDDLLKTVLLQGVTQTFESPGYFEQINVTDLNQGNDYTVNGLSLTREVMRYDEKNVVTGRKIFKNLNVDALELNHNVTIQNVDVLDWLANAVLSNGTFRIKGKKSFRNGTFKQRLSLRGKLNGQTFNQKTVMLINKHQNITGKKIFYSPTKFKALKIKGLTNDIDLEELVKHQTNKSDNTTLRSEVIFSKNVVVKNINVDVLYNNVNASSLIAKISKLRNLESFQEKFRNVLDMAVEVENSLNGQATFFKYYKEVMSLNNIYDVFGIKCKDGVFRLVAFYWQHGRNVFKTLEWSPETKTFIYSGENIESESKPNHISQITLGNQDYLYLEHEDQSNNSLYYCRILEVVNQTTVALAAEFHRRPAVSLVTFVNPNLNQSCLGFIGNALAGIDIFCDENGQHDYYWSQGIRIDGIYKATTVRTDDSVYLFLAQRRLTFQKESAVVVLQSKTGTSDFVKVQTIFEGSDLNGLEAASIGGIPYVAFSFGSQEATVESGWISVRRLDVANNQFHQWQHIPVTAPLGLHFVTETSFEPLLLVPSAGANAPLQIFRYDGIAGFKRILKGSALPISSKIRIIGRGHFLATLQDSRKVGTILGAVIKGSVGN